jgi:hypothetical protein
MNYSMILWCSDGSAAIDAPCNDKKHVYMREETQDPDGVVCDCGKTEGRFNAAKHCGATKGYAKKHKPLFES